MDTTPVIPTQEAWGRVSDAVKKVEAGVIDYGNPVTPLLQFAAYVVKVTGAASGGFYPGKILRWDYTAEDWVEVRDCYIKQE
jgi:hypothetical protein